METKLITFTYFILGVLPSAFPQITEIPFQLVGKLIVIEARVNGRSGNYILDTGASDLILNSAFFQGQPAGKVYYGINGKGEEIQMSFGRVEIQDLLWKSVYAEIFSLEYLQSRGITIHGLIGGGLLRKFEVIIDYQKQVITFVKLDKNGACPIDAPCPPPIATLPFRIKGHTPVIEAEIGTFTLRLSVDTGAEINLLAQNHFESLQLYQLGSKTTALGDFGKTARVSQATTLSGFKVQQIPCDPMKTAFAPIDHLNRFVGGKEIDGILGYEFLNQFRVGINFKKQELHLWKKGQTPDEVASN